jgi:hypothetical protein
MCPHESPLQHSHNPPTHPPTHHQNNIKPTNPPQAATSAVSDLPVDASLTAVERAAVDAVRRAARSLNNRRPEVIVVAHEHDPRYSHLPEVAQRRKAAAAGEPPGKREWQGFGGFRPSEAAAKGLGPEAVIKAGPAGAGGMGGIRTRPPVEDRYRRGGAGGRGGGGRGGRGGERERDGGRGGDSTRGSDSDGESSARSDGGAKPWEKRGPPSGGWGEVGGGDSSAGEASSEASAESSASAAPAAAAAEPAAAVPKKRGRKRTAAPADDGEGAEAGAGLPPLRVLAPEDMAKMDTVAKNPRRRPKKTADGEDLSYG